MVTSCLFGRSRGYSNSTGGGLRREVAVAGVHTLGEAVLGGDAAEQVVQLPALVGRQRDEHLVVVLSGDAADLARQPPTGLGEVDCVQRRSAGSRLRSITPRSSSASTRVTTRVGGVPRWRASSCWL